MPHASPSHPSSWASFLFFFNDTATTEIYTLSLHDALPIWMQAEATMLGADGIVGVRLVVEFKEWGSDDRSEEHTSELQSLAYLVCRLLLEKKKKQRSCKQGAAAHHNESTASSHPHCRQQQR